MSDPTNTQGTPGPDEEADLASGGPADPPDETEDGDATQDNSNTDEE